MSAIAALGAYVPAGRLPRERFGEAWGTPAAKGERSVAAGDEDSVTMAIEAARRALIGGAVDATSLGAVYLATTTAPYREKLGAATVAAALGVPKQTRTLDISDSRRCGVSALRTAAEAVDNGTIDTALVVAADCRTLEPNSMGEQLAGDGAVAFVVTSGGAIASLDGWGAVSEDVTGRWRTARDRLVREFEPRLENVAAFDNALPRACADALAATGLTSADISHVAFAGPDPRAPLTAAKSAGFAREAVVAPLISELGDAGAAGPGLALARALEAAKPGERIVMGAAGDGAEVAVLTRGDGAFGKPLSETLSERHELPSYVAYLAARDLLASDTGDGDVDVSPVAYYRRRDAILARSGGRCSSCETVQFPRADNCVECAARGTVEHYQLSDRGTLYTFTVDHLIAGRYDQRGIPRCVIDLDGGGRFYTSMTDWEPDQLKVGIPVELAFRVRGRGGGFINYGWKCRPVAA